MKKLFLTLAIFGLAAAAQAAVTPEVVSFKDLKAKDPAYSYVIQMVASYEVMSGYPDKTFRGKKTITRAEFAKVLDSTVAYLEKKYGQPLADTTSVEVTFKDLPQTHWAYPAVTKMAAQYKLLSGYPDGSFRPKKTITRFELATVLAKTWCLVETRCNLPAVSIETVALSDVKQNHWANKDIALLMKLGVMQGSKNKKGKGVSFFGNKGADRFTVATTGARLIGRAAAAIVPLPPPPPVLVSPVAKAVQITSKPQASISGAFGNVYEGASGTNNWSNFNATATYGDTFKLWSLAGNYELTGKYGFDQIIYMVPSGSAIKGSVVSENRYEFEVNTIYPVVDWWGVSGKVLLGLKYLTLSNPTAPTNFTGFNAGVVTAAQAFGRNILLRGFWSLPLVRAAVSPSVLGQPAQLFDYEASIDSNIFYCPVLIGLSGELMTFTNYGQRWYNLAFVRYYLF